MTNDQAHIKYETTYTLSVAGKVVATHEVLTTEHSLDLIILVARNADIEPTAAIVEQCHREHTDMLGRQPALIHDQGFVRVAQGLGLDPPPRGETSERIMCDDCGEITDPRDLAGCGGCNATICSACNEGLHEGRCQGNTA